MSSLNWSALQTIARGHWWYYPLRDMLKLKMLKKWLALRHAKLPYPGQWRPYKSAVKVVQNCRFKKHPDVS